MNYVEKFDSGLFSAQGAFSGAGESFSVDVHPRSSALGHGGADTIVVPDAHLLFSGDYKRSGLDLVLSKDGHEFVARDYFRGESRASLASPDGASLSGTTVGALAGQVDYAQAGGNIAPEKVIGQVTKLTGSATAIRNGVSISLNVGDNVHKSDVVQCESDSSLGITFIDGTVFGLSSNARMVLNEMVYNPNGSNNSSLLTLVQGTISFVAGATAKNGDMKVETPTATMGIRGTAVLVEIDFDIPQPGMAPPVSFRILVEPNGTSGEYVLLDKLTLQPIATVNQPGTQTIVNGQGVVTFIASAQIPTNAQQLINEIFTLKFTDANPKYIGIPPLNSITPDTFLPKLPDGTPIDRLPIIRIAMVFEPVAGPPPSGGNTRFHLNIPPELVASSNHFAERFLTTGNTALDTVSGTIHFDDINPEDRPTVTAQFNSFVYRNAQQDIIVTSSLTLEQLAAIKAVQVPLSVVPDPDNTNVGDARWTYSVPDHALDFLAEGETLTLTYMARVDTNYSEYNTVVFTPFTITITGTNDLPTAAATGSGIIELDGTSNPEIGHAEGVITFADVDLTDRPTVTAPFASYVYTAANGSPLTLTPAQRASLEATLTLTPAASNTNNGSVAWSYDVADANFDFIAAGETLVLTYNAIVDDGHGGVVIVPLTLTVTVNGTNDIPTITATSDGFVELVGTTGNANPDHAGGTITFTDVDLTDRPAISAHFSGYTYMAANGTTALTLTPAQLNALAISLTLTPSQTNANNGSVTWSYDLADAKFDFLAAGETLKLTYTATVNDGHGGVVSTPITVTVTGTNDVPSVAISDLTGAVIEAVTPAGNLTDTGTIAFTDVDLTDTHVISPNIVPSPGALGVLTASVTTDTTNSGLGGVVTWNYSVAASDVEYLAKDQTKVEQFTITLDDGNGGTINRTIEVTITGTNDDPVVATSDLTGAVTEAATQASHLTDTGTIAFADVDLTDTHVISQNIVPSPGALGVLTASVTTDSTGWGLGGVVTWNYSVAASDVEYLAKDQTKVEQFTITLDDGNGGTIDRTIEVTITGTNDDPVVAVSDLTGAVIEAATQAGNLTDTGTIAFTDVDLTDTHIISPNILPSPGALGALTASVTTDSTGSGLGGVVTWNYSVTASDVEYLAKDQTKVEQFTITLDDGNGGTIDRTIEVTITGTNDAPVLAAGIALTTITEDDTANPGQPVSSFATGMDDVDTGAVQGIAITGFTSANGHWEFSTDSATSWTSFASYSATSALLLTDSDLVRFVPDGDNGGTDTLSYVAWDQTSGIHGTTADTSANGGSTAFSAASDTVSLDVTDVNDAPVISMANLQISEINSTTFSGISVSDVDASLSELFTITTATAAPGSSVTGSGSSTLAGTNATLNAGIVYDPGLTPPQTDMVSVTVADASDATDTVNFIFNVAGPLQGGAVTLASTSEKDVLFGTAYEDQFVFEANSNCDTVIDFTHGIDHIDLSALSFVNSGNIGDFLTSSGGDTLIALDSNDIIVVRDVASLQASDFILHA